MKKSTKAVKLGRTTPMLQEEKEATVEDIREAMEKITNSSYSYFSKKACQSGFSSLEEVIRLHRIFSTEYDD